LKTRNKRERDELALRLLIPREDLIRWAELANLAITKGLGIENLRLLEKVGVHSVTVLAGEDPDRLYERMRQVSLGRATVRKAKIRIWIREAQKKLRREE
jgi:hypothetical protein